jgi:hypothetical protein
VWQALRAELYPRGIEFVTVGLDAVGIEACRPFIAAAKPEHPSLVDSTHATAAAFGVVNIPNAVWIDEAGIIVRPAEAANPRGGPPDTAPARAPQRIEGLPDRMNDIMQEAAQIRVDGRYPDMLRDWAEHGAGSRYALSPADVVWRSRPRDSNAARAQAHLELGAALWSRGEHRGAEAQWREAHRLDPENFTAKRQAWSLASPGTGAFERFWQGPVPGREDEWPYESDWLSEVQQKGAANYYPPLDA